MIDPSILTQLPPRNLVAFVEFRVSRNDPCPCGSHRKYKRCCLPRLETPQAQAALRLYERAYGPGTRSYYLVDTKGM
jgi:hypothetical protein